MNFKMLLFAIGGVVAFGACASLASCVDSTRILQVDAVSYEYDTFNLSLLNDGAIATGYDSYQYADAGAVVDQSGYYIVSTLEVQYAYYFDPEDYESLEYYIVDVRPVMYYYSVDNFSKAPTFYQTWYPCFMIDYTTSPVSISCGSSKADAFPAVVPYTMYANMFTGITRDLSTSSLSSFPMVMSYTLADLRSIGYEINSSIATWLTRVYFSPIDMMVSQLVTAKASDVAYGMADYYNDEMTDYGQTRYDEGWRVGYNQGQASVTDDMTAVNNLFGSLWNVPMSVINGLSPLVLWGTPIISILLTFLLLGVVIWCIRRFI